MFHISILKSMQPSYKNHTSDTLYYSDDSSHVNLNIYCIFQYVFDCFTCCLSKLSTYLMYRYEELFTHSHHAISEIASKICLLLYFSENGTSEQVNFLLSVEQYGPPYKIFRLKLFNPRRFTAISDWLIAQHIVFR